MITVLQVLFLLVCFALAVVVLLQAGRGGGLAAGFGGSGTGFELLGGRQTATFLHQATRWLGGAFLLLAFVIAILTARGNRPGSLIEREFGGQPAPVEQGSAEDLESAVGGAPGAATTGDGPVGAPGEAGGAGGGEDAATPQPTPEPSAPAPVPAPDGAPPANP